MLVSFVIIYVGKFYVFYTFFSFNILQQDFMVQYLKEVKHPKANNIRRCKPRGFTLKWKTSGNGVDCGIFVMRHMESYMGEIVSKYVSGFVTESDEQKKQLNNLRCKYVTKLLLSDLNTSKDKVIEQAEAYHMIDEIEKMQISQTAIEKKKERFDAFLKWKCKNEP